MRCGGAAPIARKAFPDLRTAHLSTASYLLLLHFSSPLEPLSFDRLLRTFEALDVMSQRYERVSEPGMHP